MDQQWFLTPIPPIDQVVSKGIYKEYFRNCVYPNIVFVNKRQSLSVFVEEVIVSQPLFGPICDGS